VELRTKGFCGGTPAGKLAGRLRRPLLPTKGMRVRVADLQRGPEAGISSTANSLLEGRPALQRLPACLGKKQIRPKQVGGL